MLVAAAAPDDGSAFQEPALKALCQAFGRRFGPAPDPVFTTDQAARLVVVNRPYMAKLIESGAVEPHMMAGNRHRVRGSAVIRGRKKKRAKQARAFKRLPTFASME